MPLVSVVVPAYKIGHLAQRFAEKLNQTYSNIEFIFIDDCSPDNTYQALMQLKENNPSANIQVLRNEHNLGAGETRNRGLQEAHGEFIYFCDADDSLDPTLIEKMVDAVQREQADFAVCSYKCFYNENGQQHVKLFPTNKNILNAKTIEEVKEHAFSFPFPPWSKLIKRQFLLDHNIKFPNIRISQDQCWTIEMVLLAQKIAFVNEPLYHYFIEDSSLSSCNQKNALCLIETIDYNAATLHRLGYEQLRDRAQSAYLSVFVKYYQKTAPEFREEFAHAFVDCFNKHNYCLNPNKFPLSAKLPLYKAIPKFAASTLRANLKIEHNHYGLLCSVRKLLSQHMDISKID